MAKGSESCQHCGQADSLEHRLAHCSFGKAVSRRADTNSEEIPKVLLEAGGAESLLARRGWFHKWHNPMPKDEFDIQCFPSPPEGELFTLDPSQETYIDGSAFFSADPYLASAGASVIQHDRGAVTKRLTASIPLEFPRQAAFAEHLAAMLTERHYPAGHQPKAVADCASVVTASHRGRDFAVGEKRTAAGLWVDMRSSGIQVRKTKAHRSYGEAKAQGDETDWIGNDLADTWAKKAAANYLPPADQQQKRLDFTRSVEAYLKGVSRLLYLWKPIPRKSVPRAPRQPIQKAPHEPVFHGGFRVWKCSSCFKVAKSRARLMQSACKKIPRVHMDFIKSSSGLGHRLFHARYSLGPGSVTFCARCGLYSELKQKGLGKACRGGCRRQRWVHKQMLERWEAPCLQAAGGGPH